MSAMRKDFALDRRSQRTIKKQEDLESAFYLWIDSLEPKERDHMTQKVFRHHIAPQLKMSSIARPQDDGNEFSLSKCSD